MSRERKGKERKERKEKKERREREKETIVRQEGKRTWIALWVSERICVASLCVSLFWLVMEGSQIEVGRRSNQVERMTHRRSGCVNRCE